MEEVFDFRDFVFTLLKKFKSVIILGIILGILGAIGGYLTASSTSVSKTYTSTEAVSINIADGTKMPQWTPNNMTAMIDSLCTSDFVYLGFAEYLNTQGIISPVSTIESPAVTDVKAFAKFYTKGNLLLSDIMMPSSEDSVHLSNMAIDYLTQTVTGIINNIEVTKLKGQQSVVTVTTSRTRRTIKYGIFGGAGGVCLAIFIIFFVDVFDLRVKSAKDLKKYGIPVFADISERRNPHA